MAHPPRRRYLPRTTRFVGGVALAGALLAGCVGPAARYDGRATAVGFVRTERAGLPFRHAVFAPAGVGAAPDLRVYLEGDGTPWRRPGLAADDPTPRVPLALELLARDRGAAILVGRPCYHLRRADPACAAGWWTERRYSPEVVASLARAIDAEARARGARRLTLVGYSGGGVLAMLLAPRLPRATRVVTVAANLDVAAWTAHHGYPPLAASLDPARGPPPGPAVAQVHYLGARDTNVPPVLLERLRVRAPTARWEIVADFDHHCCWVDRWPALLAAAVGTAAD